MVPAIRELIGWRMRWNLYINNSDEEGNGKYDNRGEHQKALRSQDWWRCGRT